MSAGDDRSVLELLDDGRRIARSILENWVSGDLAGAVNELERWAGQADALLNTAAAQYAQAVCDAPDLPQPDPDDYPFAGPPSDPIEVLAELTLAELAPFKLTQGAPLPAVPESGDIPLPNGCRLYWKTEQSIKCREYFSDEVGGGAQVWSPAIIAPSTLLAAIVCEEHLGRLELEHARRRAGDA